MMCGRCTKQSWGWMQVLTLLVGINAPEGRVYANANGEV